jgi:hypothetical protein
MGQSAMDSKGHDMADKSASEISVKFGKSQDYRMVPATGVLGGINPQGELVCNFFVEYSETPERIRLTLDGKGGISSENKEPEMLDLVRELQVGVVLRPDIARSIGKWMIAQSERMSPMPPSNTPIH